MMERKVMASTKKSQWGMALPMALIMLVLASFIVVPSLMAIQSLLTINSKVSQKTLAYYAADAGVAYLTWKLKTGGATEGKIQDGGGDALINGMNVELKQPVAGSWEVSALSGTVSKVQIYVTTDSQGNNLFDDAVVALGGNITVNNDGKVVVVPDDIFIMDYCDSALGWTRKNPPQTGSGWVTGTANRDAAYRETGVCYDLGGSAGVAMTTNAVLGDLAYKNTETTENIAPYQYISVWILSTVALSSDDLSFVIATNTNLNPTGGTVRWITIPYSFTAGVGKRVSLNNTDCALFSSLKSIGIYQNFLAGSKGPYTLYVDNVIATNHDVTADDRSKKGDMHANGKIDIKNIARVGGTASATGTVAVAAGAYAGDQKPGVTALANPFTTAYVKIYTDQGDAGTDYTSSAGSWNSGAGTITIGPGYIDGDVTLGGTKNFVLTGTIHVRASGKKNGDLTISTTGSIQGPYTIVSDGKLIVSGKSSATTMLAADNIPTLLCRGDPVTMTVAGGPRISANIYAPNAAATITDSIRDTPPLDFNVYGSVIAKSVIMNSYATVRYLIPVSAKLVAYDYR